MVASEARLSGKDGVVHRGVESKHYTGFFIPACTKNLMLFHPTDKPVTCLECLADGDKE